MSEVDGQVSLDPHQRFVQWQQQPKSLEPVLQPQLPLQQVEPLLLLVRCLALLHSEVLVQSGDQVVAVDWNAMSGRSDHWTYCCCCSLTNATSSSVEYRYGLQHVVILAEHRCYLERQQHE